MILYGERKLFENTRMIWRDSDVLKRAMGLIVLAYRDILERGEFVKHIQFEGVGIKSISSLMSSVILIFMLFFRQCLIW